ncbi:hypothetical protein NL676_021014 [Syzygium grande]|nr:hypothetical protein NL676_021014 [Syzygium grande]
MGIIRKHARILQHLGHPKQKEEDQKRLLVCKIVHTPRRPSDRDSTIIRNERAQARQGYGLFMSETGNSYLRMPGSDRVIDIGGPSFSNEQTRARNVQVSVSQSSIDVSESPCTQQSGIGGGL